MGFPVPTTYMPLLQTDNKISKLKPAPCSPLETGVVLLCFALGFGDAEVAPFVFFLRKDWGFTGQRPHFEAS